MSSNYINYIVLAESELIILLKSGDKRAFEQLYNNYKLRLYRNILKIVKTEEQAGQILQETFVKLWNGRGNIDPHGPFRNYLFKTAEDLIYEVFREAALNQKRQNYFITTANGNDAEKHIYRKGDTGELFKGFGFS